MKPVSCQDSTEYICHSFALESLLFPPQWVMQRVSEQREGPKDTYGARMMGEAHTLGV